MYNDKRNKKLAEASKAVMAGKVKETEVQPSDQDFVDLHSIDKEKRRGSEPLTEKDVEEANEFTKAAAKAAVAGDSEFEFEGKKFPTEMDVDVAKKILGESVNLAEANTDKYMWSDINNALKAAGLDIRTILSVVSKLKGKEIKEEINLDEAFIDVDAADPKSPEFAKLLRKYRVKAKIITMKGPGGGLPLVKLSGKKKDLEGILKDPMGWQDNGFLAGFIEESADSEKAIEEAIKGLSEEQIDELIGGLLKKGASALGKAVKSRVTKSGRQDRADKKHKLDVRGKKLEIKKKINDILDKKSKAQKKLRDTEKNSEAAKALDDKINGYKTRIDQLNDKMKDIAESDIEESDD